MNRDAYFGGAMMMESDDDDEHSDNPSCLIRYRSAPSSYFSDFIDDSARIDYVDLHPPSSTPEIDTLLDRFISYDSSSSSSSRFDHLQTSPISVSEQPSPNCKTSAVLPPRPHHCAAASSAAASNMQNPQSSILIRHGSSPAQLSSHDISETGIVDQRREGTPDHLSFNTVNPSSPPSPGIGALGVAGVDQMPVRDEGGGGKCYISGYPVTPWKCQEKMNSINGWEDNGMNSRNGMHKSGTGVEYMRLPSSPIPCMTRAKRGCATHPRSIAERVRRTRISERMRKLEELVPNMEKQTSTADMLDLAVEYIKDLQQQVKILSEMGAKCTCKDRGKAGGMGVVVVVGTGTMAAPATETAMKG